MPKPGRAGSTRRDFGVQTFWFQAVCQNHIVWDATEVVEFSRKHTANVHESLNEIRRLAEGLVDKRDARRDGFVNVMRKAMGQKFCDDADEVLEILNKRGITKKLAKEALEIARQRGGFTIFALVDALTRLSGKFANAGDRSEADVKAFALLALAAQRLSPPAQRRWQKVQEATHHRASLHSCVTCITLKTGVRGLDRLPCVTIIGHNGRLTHCCPTLEPSQYSFALFCLKRSVLPIDERAN